MIKHFRQDKQYEINVRGRWHPAFYVGLDEDGDATFQIRGKCQYESYSLPTDEIRENPRKISGWVNVYDGDQPDLMSLGSKTSADISNANYERSTGKQRIACIYVSGTEGIGPYDTNT